MEVVSLFSGIGGIELGLHSHGFNTQLFCEIDGAAQDVLGHHFPEVPIVDDVAQLRSIPKCDVLSAGFPCQDLSQAGKKAGISGSQSSLVSHIHRLVSRPGYKRPTWIVMENVPYMLRLGRGSAMDYVIEMIQSLGYKWAYRVVDARAFGVPQRRPRVIILASKRNGSKSGFVGSDSNQPFQDSKPSDVLEDKTYGFYWTEEAEVWAGPMRLCRR